MIQRNRPPHKRFNISLSQDLVSKIDNAAKKEFCSRSAYIRMSVIQQLNADDHLEQSLVNPQSYFNIIKQANLTKNVHQSWNQLKHKDINWND